MLVWWETDYSEDNLELLMGVSPTIHPNMGSLKLRLARSSSSELIDRSVVSRHEVLEVFGNVPLQCDFPDSHPGRCTVGKNKRRIYRSLKVLDRQHQHACAKH